MTDLRTTVENNLVLWILGMLLTGFVSGMATHKAVLEMMTLETISKDRLKMLELMARPNRPHGGGPVQNEPLPAHVTQKEINNLFDKIQDSFNARDTKALYSMLGPIARAQFSKDAADTMITPLFDSLGRIEEGFYIGHVFVGSQGLYKSFRIDYFAKYEKAERGGVTIHIIDDGSSYQISSVFHFRM